MVLKLKIKNLVLLGKILKEKRNLCSFYRSEEAKLPDISVNNLRRYEDYNREISIIFYKLMQLYEVGDISTFFIKCSMKNEFNHFTLKLHNGDLICHNILSIPRINIIICHFLLL